MRAGTGMGRGARGGCGPGSDGDVVTGTEVRDGEVGG